MTTTTTTPRTAPHRSRRTLVTILVLVVGLSAFGLSFMVLRDLAALAGIPDGVAWLWPVIVDGTIAVTTLAAYVSTNSSATTVRTARPGARLQKFTLVLFVIVSVVGNVAHILLAEPDVPWALAVFVAAVPPVGLFLSFEQLVAMLRTGAAAVADADGAAEAVVQIEAASLSAPAPVAEVARSVATALDAPPTDIDTVHDDAPRFAETLQAVHHADPSSRAMAHAERTMLESVARPVEHAERPAHRPAPRARQLTVDQMAQSEVVERALGLIEGGASKRSAAEQLGVAPTTLTRWIKAADEAASSAPAPEAEPAFAA